MLLHITMATLQWELPAPAENGENKNTAVHVPDFHVAMQQQQHMLTQSWTISQPEQQSNEYADWVPDVAAASNTWYKNRQLRQLTSWVGFFHSEITMKQIWGKIVHVGCLCLSSPTRGQHYIYSGNKGMILNVWWPPPNAENFTIPQVLDSVFQWGLGPFRHRESNQWCAFLFRILSKW